MVGNLEGSICIDLGCLFTKERSSTKLDESDGDVGDIGCEFGSGPLIVIVGGR